MGPGGEKLRRAVARVTRPSYARFSVATQRWLLSVALVIFVGGGLLVLSRLDIDFGSLRWAYIAAAVLIGVPLTAAMNAFEFLLSARMVGARVSFSSALRISVAATAANLLPIPGGPLVRIQALRRLGQQNKDALSSIALVGLVWLGIAALAAGTVLLAMETSLAGWLMVVVGLVSLPAGFGLLMALPQVTRRAGMFGCVVAVEVGIVMVAALRLLLIIWGLGMDATMSDALVLAVSGVLAAAVGILPGGLGLREGLAAALAPLVGLSPSLGFAVTGLDRVVGILTHAPLTAALMTRKTDQYSFVSDGMEVEANEVSSKWRKEDQ